MKDEFIAKCTTIRKDQNEFIKTQEGFKLSRFLQAKLDGYIKLMKDYKQFMEDKNEKKT